MDQGVHKCIVALITILGVCLTLKFPNASPFETNGGSVLMKLFIVDLVIYIASLAFMTHPKISLLSGSLAIVLELLIVYHPFGLFMLIIWFLCFPSVVFNSYQQWLITHYGAAIAGLRLHIGDEFKERLIELQGRLIESTAFVALSRVFEKLKDLICCQNQTSNDLPA